MVALPAVAAVRAALFPQRPAIGRPGRMLRFLRSAGHAVAHPSAPPANDFCERELVLIAFPSSASTASRPFLSKWAKSTLRGRRVLSAVQPDPWLRDTSVRKKSRRSWADDHQRAVPRRIEIVLQPIRSSVRSR